MSFKSELYGIDDETYERLANELERETEGQNKVESIKRLLRKWSTDKRDQKEIVVLSFMMGLISGK